jgi:hypothetical protein
LPVYWHKRREIEKMAAERGKKAKRVRVAPFVTMLFFLILGIFGIMTGEVNRVLAQAIQVCLSCIGIG